MLIAYLNGLNTKTTRNEYFKEDRVYVISNPSEAMRKKYDDLIKTATGNKQ